MNKEQLIKYITKYGKQLTPPEKYLLLNSVSDYFKKQSQRFVDSSYNASAEMPPESEIIKEEGHTNIN